MADSGNPMVNAAVSAPASADPEDQGALWPGYRRSRRRAAEQSSDSEPEIKIDAPEHQLDSLG